MRFRRIHIPIAIGAIVIGSCLTAHALAQETQPEPPKMIRKAGGVLQQSATTRVEPDYPTLAKAARVFGDVDVEVLIDENGDVIAAKAVSGHPLLKDSAVSAARGWKFSKTQLGGVPVKVAGTLTFTFSLPADKPSPDSSANGDIDEARKAVITNAYSPEAHLKLAHAYVARDMSEEATESYKRAIELKPAYKEAYLGLASVFRRQNKRDEEVAIYRQAITALPGDPQLLEAAARALSETERYAEAIDVQKRVVQLRPDDPRSHDELGRYLFRARRYQDAISASQKSLRLRPKNALAYHSIGAAYMNLGRWEDAIAAYTELLTVDPKYSQAYRVHTELGTAYLRSRGASEALEQFKRAIELNPGYAVAHGELCGLSQAGAQRGSGSIPTKGGRDAAGYRHISNLARRLLRASEPHRGSRKGIARRDQTRSGKCSSVNRVGGVAVGTRQA